MTTLSADLSDAAQLFDPNVVKLVTDARGYALYFSRAPIPWNRDEFANRESLPSSVEGYRRHIGLYAYRAGFWIDTSNGSLLRSSWLSHSSSSGYSGMANGFMSVRRQRCRGKAWIPSMIWTCLINCFSNGTDHRLVSNVCANLVGQEFQKLLGKGIRYFSKQWNQNGFRPFPGRFAKQVFLNDCFIGWVRKYQDSLIRQHFMQHPLLTEMVEMTSNQRAHTQNKILIFQN